MERKAQEQGNKMKKRIFHNWGLKVGSLILAFLLWLLVIQFDDPAENKTFRGVPVALVNTELLEQQNKVYEVLDNTDKITVTVRAPGSIIKDLESSDIVAVADIGKLTEINTIAISLSLQSTDDVESIKSSPDVLRLNVENRKTKRIGLRYNIVGEVAEGYIVSNAQLDLNQIEITGPESAVDRVSDACVDVDVTGAMTNLSANVDVQLFDAEGNLAEHSGITKNVNYVRMTVEVLATKEVPVVVSAMGTPAEGYLVAGEIQCEPAAVTIAGTPLALASVSRIVIPPEETDITGANGTVTSRVNIRTLLSNLNIKIADSAFNGIVTVTIPIEEEAVRDLEIDPEAISILNVPEGVSVRMAEEQGPCRLSVSGLKSEVDQVTVGSLAPRVDLAAWMGEQGIEELRHGIHRVPLTVTLPDDMEMAESATVQIMVEEMEEM